MASGIAITEEITAFEALVQIVRDLKADSGTIHLIGEDGMLHLAAATHGFPEIVLKTIKTIPVGRAWLGVR